MTNGGMSREELILKKMEIQGKLSEIPDTPENYEQRRNLKRLLNRYEVLIAKDNIAHKVHSKKLKESINHAILTVLKRELGNDRWCQLRQRIEQGEKEDFNSIKIFTEEETDVLLLNKDKLTDHENTALKKKLSEVEKIAEQFSDDLDINEMRYLLKKIKAKLTNETILTADMVIYHKSK